MTVPNNRRASFMSLLISWTTPHRQVRYLLAQRNFKDWEAFRDSLVRRWTNLNVVCGLIMGAISTILFANFSIDPAAFALGVTSLLSSLIAIGFGVGLIYVLGDVKGFRLHVIGTLYPKLWIFALSIPQIWAGTSFCAFFACMCVIVWQVSNKELLIRVGVVLAVLVLLMHVVGFAFLFHHDHPEYLIPVPDHAEAFNNLHENEPLQGQQAEPTTLNVLSAASNQAGNNLPV